jgi:two-component sensor histidine kinase
MVGTEMVDATENRLDAIQRIHEDLHDLLFQHISGIACSEVSKNWSIAIANSPKALNRIQLNLSPKNGKEHPSDEDLDIIMNR